MSMAAEPRPASLPLPGGSAEATVRLHPLLVATMSAPPTFLHGKRGRLASMRALGVGVDRDAYVEVPVVAFLVEHPTAGALLIDTGLHGSAAIEPETAMGRLGGMVFKDVSMEPEQNVADQVRARGLAPSDVRTIVMTHLHADQAGGIGHFPDATFVVAAPEWQAAVEGGERDGYVKRRFDHAFDYRLIEFEGRHATSFASFGHALDLFGDGSVMLVATPGHTLGHLSVVLRLAGGREALICGDAAQTTAILDGEQTPGRTDDEHRHRRSLREIQLYREQTPTAVVIPGHDLEAFRALDDVL